jgi:hypothetical protein
MNNLEESLKAVDKLFANMSTEEFEADYLKIHEQYKDVDSPTCEEFIKHLDSKVFAIKDRFHPSINGEKQPEVRSDHENFENRDDFMAWCKQHGAENSEIYVIQE